MVERFNGRIADVLKTHHFDSREELEQTLLRYVHLYNNQLPHQSALKSRPPIMAMKEWHKIQPELFNKRPYNHTDVTNSHLAYFSNLSIRLYTAVNFSCVISATSATL